MQDDVADAFRKAMRLDGSFSIADPMSFDDIPGWDSVGHMNLVTELESRFGISSRHGRDRRPGQRGSSACRCCPKNKLNFIGPSSRLSRRSWPVADAVARANRHPDAGRGDFLRRAGLR